MPTRSSSSSLPSDDVVAAGAPLRVDVSCPAPSTVVVTPVGEADVCTVAPLRQALTDAADAGRPRVVVDLDRLAFMDASTLGVLVEARLRVRAFGGVFELRCGDGHRRKVLSLTGLDGMLDLAT